MTQLSKNKLRPPVKKEFIDGLIEAVHKQRNTDDLKDFLDHLLTPVEIETFAKRLEVFKKLRKGLTYAEIGEKAKVTGATITKMNNILLKANDEFLKFINSLVEENEREEKKEKNSKYSKGSKQVYRKRIN